LVPGIFSNKSPKSAKNKKPGRREKHFGLIQVHPTTVTKWAAFAPKICAERFPGISKIIVLILARIMDL
jgi:DNA-binding transcriptional regulator YdaS (Cro superfamily)